MGDTTLNQTLALVGSKCWLQVAVNRYPDVIDDAIPGSIGLNQCETIECLSPLESEDSIEYRDQAFLERLGIIPGAGNSQTSGPRADRYGTAWLVQAPCDLS